MNSIRSIHATPDDALNTIHDYTFFQHHQLYVWPPMLIFHNHIYAVNPPQSFQEFEHQHDAMAGLPTNFYPQFPAYSPIFPKYHVGYFHPYRRPSFVQNISAYILFLYRLNYPCPPNMPL